MLSFALVSAAVASGTALTKPVENPLRRLSESDPTGGACSAEAVAGIASDPPTFGVSAICSTSTCVPWLVTYVEANIATVEGAIAMYGTGTAYDDMLVELEATLTQVQSLSAVCPHRVLRRPLHLVLLLPQEEGGGPVSAAPPPARRRSAHRKERAARARNRVTLEQASVRVLRMCLPLGQPHLVLASRPPIKTD